MKKAILPFCIAFCCFAPSIIAQPPCGFDQIHQRLMKTDPEYARTIQANDAAIRQYINKHPGLSNPNSANREMAIVTIPVVVHVMHTGGAVGTIYNPSDAQIIGAINYLNQVYAGTYPGMTAFSPTGAAGDLEVRFGLAQRTPSCGATNGIDRVDASSIPNYTAGGVNSGASGPGTSEINVKNLARWNVNDYYNIWVVNRIDGADGTSGQFIAGYAYFPGAPATLDGTIMLATQMTTGAKTLPHEIGHALNLHHPFNGSVGYTTTPNTGDCPANTTCGSQGDLVCDTDPIYNNLDLSTGIYSFAPRSGANICAPPNNYGINTESNFMSYTSVYTLFTNGQKSRITAALSLASRASLISGSNMALVPCGTNINFNQASDSHTEDITGTLTGCRRYRDYSYQMSIGSAPSATATATLTFGGTAIRGIDYDVTTNGDFTSPSLVLTFLSGSTTSQSYTVRVYDDADVEPSQTAIIDFTLNNGGGNAAKGITAPTFTLTIPDNDSAPVAAGGGTFSIGTASDFITEAPFDATLQQQRAQYLYKASELTAAGVIPGNITSFQLFIQNKLSTRPFTNFSIKMAHSGLNYLVNGSISVVGGMTTVFTSASYSTIAGWNNFILSTPFAWNGTNSLAVEICFDNVTANAGSGSDEVQVYSDGGTVNQGNLFFQNTINCNGSFSSVTWFNFGYKPIIRLTTSVTGTPIETVATSTTNIHVGTGSNDYFYSNNNRLLMRLSGVSAPLGCVTSTLENAGTSWVSYFGGQRSAKVFAVTPTTNVGTTSYTISLYFDNTELGGKNPASLRIAKTTAASAAASNTVNTQNVVPTVTTLGSGVTVFTATFTGFSRFFLIDAGVTLPVEIVDFNGKLNNEKNTVLHWKTASEQNNKQFNIELSNDAINFALLGTVAADGNSATEKNYEYLHLKPQTGTTWYRLKQIDIDGHFKYSNIISVTVSKDIVKPFLYPVPSKDIITVNFGSLVNKASLEVLTTDMKIVKRETVNSLSLKKEINIQGLSKGVYFIKLNVYNNTQLLRFVKE